MGRSGIHADQCSGDRGGPVLVAVAVSEPREDTSATATAEESHITDIVCIADRFQSVRLII
jgi:hypothetical protein